MMASIWQELFMDTFEDWEKWNLEESIDKEYFAELTKEQRHKCYGYYVSNWNKEQDL